MGTLISIAIASLICAIILHNDEIILFTVIIFVISMVISGAFLKMFQESPDVRVYSSVIGFGVIFFTFKRNKISIGDNTNKFIVLCSTSIILFVITTSCAVNIFDLSPDNEFDFLLASPVINIVGILLYTFVNKTIDVKTKNRITNEHKQTVKKEDVPSATAIARLNTPVTKSDEEITKKIIEKISEEKLKEDMLTEVQEESENIELNKEEPHRFYQIKNLIALLKVKQFTMTIDYVENNPKTMSIINNLFGIEDFSCLAEYIFDPSSKRNSNNYFHIMYKFESLIETLWKNELNYHFLEILYDKDLGRPHGPYGIYNKEYLKLYFLSNEDVKSFIKYLDITSNLMFKNIQKITKEESFLLSYLLVKRYYRKTKAKEFAILFKSNLRSKTKLKKMAPDEVLLLAIENKIIDFSCEKELEKMFYYFITNKKLNHNISKYAYNEYMDLIEEANEKFEEINIIRTLSGDTNYNRYDNTNNNENTTYSIYDTDIMTSAEFEHFVAFLFEKMGYSTEVTKQSNDMGIDVIAKNQSMSIGIQAKCYSAKVGNTAVQEVLSGILYYKLDKAIVVTNSWFTKQAIDLADKTGVILHDRSILEENIKLYL